MPARRFEATEKTSVRELQSTLRQMEATGLKISQDYETGACEIIFDRKGRRYVFRNGRWANPLDNLRAVQLSISLLYRAVEQYGTTSQSDATGADPFDQFFAGFQALPGDSTLMLPSGQRDWWEVLGVKRDASTAEIGNAYRSLAKVHHPDYGGDQETFKRLRAAYDQAMRERS